MTRTVELTPVDNRKSFYGKAYAEINGDTITLRSYGTAILRLTGDKLTRCWHGWSQTTQRHINAFLTAYGCGECGKAFYDTIPFED